MIDIFNVKTPMDIQLEIASNVRKRRKAMKLSQEMLSKKSGVSLGSLKRFETKGEISLLSLVKIGVALECEDDFLELFKKKYYQSIQEIIDEQL